VQVEFVRLPVAPAAGEADLLVVTVAGGVGDAVDVGQRLRVAEVAGFAQGQVERNLGAGVPVLLYGEGRAAA
jgi:hypothetical protein